MGTVLVVLGFYASQYIASGIGVTSTTIGSIDTGFVIIKAIELSDTLSLIVGSFIISLFYDIHGELVTYGK
ncbi:MAG TPA: hypothetical protein PK957_00715 [Candidatus Dojkabacteria bacterium]|nr:hypothetical protein [Candidatus Dojkabacteria bacterium]HQF36711.1 hypothetical protein [Candidatus Dojkabacteria bacterium]